MSDRQTGVAETRRRIIEAAADLFSRGGYNGASTRGIARAANINEATLFRHYSSKRGLYLAVLETELQKLRLRGDLLLEVAGAPDVHAALANTFELVRVTLEEHRDLLRLIQFSSLELGKDFEPLLRKNFGELIEVVAGYLQPWIDNGQMQCSQAKMVVLTLVAIVLNSYFLYPIFTDGSPSVTATLQAQADLCNMIAPQA